MVVTSLLLASLVAFASSAAYGCVAYQLQKRAPRHGGDRWALGYFVVWWAATAVNIFFAGFLYLAASMGRITFGAQLLDSILQRVLLAVSLWGLMTYLLFLVFERRMAFGTGIAYAIHAALMLAILNLSNPIGVDVSDWRTDLIYEKEPVRALELVNFVAVVLAPVGASVAYLSIGLRLPKEHSEQRWRAVVVACSMIVWWVVAVVAGQQELRGAYLFQFVNRLLGLLASLAILFVYIPPAWLRRRWDAKLAQATPLSVDVE